MNLTGSSSYHFVSHWRVVGTVQEVASILENPRELPRWWPSVYLKVEELSPGDERGVGRVVQVLTKGWLPYTLSWQFRVTESHHPFGFTLEAAGDFVGRGVWTFEQEGAWVNVTYDWEIEVTKNLLQVLSPILRPAFAANHRWAMRRGEESLEIELARRRAGTAAERASLPAAPPPTTTSPVPLLVVGFALLAGTLGIFRMFARARRRRRRFFE